MSVRMRRLYAWLPIRGLSLVVFAVLLAGSLTASAFARGVMHDQEHRMLRQRAGEAAALLTNLVTQSQASTKSLVAVVLATNGDPKIFQEAAGRDPALANGGAAALVASEGGVLRIVAAQGKGLTPGQDLSGEAATAIGRARTTDTFVNT